jgi:hypothetical protein
MKRTCRAGAGPGGRQIGLSPGATSLAREVLTNDSVIR